MQAAIIDSHAHVLRREAPLVAERHSAPAHDATVEDYVALLDKHGIAHGVLTAPSFYGTDNSLLLAALDAQPERLRGTVIVAPDVGEDALAEMSARGVVGIRLNWIRRSALPNVAAPEYRRLFRLASDLGWHVEVFLEGPKLAAVLPRIRESGVKVVVDHFGLPDAGQRVRDAGFQEALRGVRDADTWVKLSAAYRLDGVDPRRYVDALLDAGGPAQLVWASDWPFVSHEEDVTYQQCVDAIESWIPDDSARNTVLSEAPMKLFGFDKKRPPSLS